MFFLSGNELNAVKLTYSAQQKYASLVKMKEKSKSQNQILKKKVSLELFHRIFVHSSKR